MRYSFLYKHQPKEKTMNRAANKTTITICTTDAKQSNKYAIRKRVEFDAFGRQHVIEHIRGIRI
ncbi:MAG: hypothetical protein H0W99_03705 [Acidobacteria bacterium]|nr:hypothetical protein [Acidobacteriota bacterium]